MTKQVRRFWIPATALSTLGWNADDVELVQAADFDALREELEGKQALSEIFYKRQQIAESKLTTAQQRNAGLIDCAEELADLVEASLGGDYKADSYTTQPIRNALAALKPTESGESNDTNL